MRTTTNSFGDRLDRVARERGQRTERPLPGSPLVGQRGVIIGIGGRVLGMELLATPTALTQRWNGILEAARFDAECAPGRRGTETRRPARVVGVLPERDRATEEWRRIILGEHLIGVRSADSGWVPFDEETQRVAEGLGHQRTGAAVMGVVGHSCSFAVATDKAAGCHTSVVALSP